MMSAFISIITENTIVCAFAFVQFLIARWMLELSTPEKDMRWLKIRCPVLFRLRWYRGFELWHQWQGARMLKTV